MQASAHAQSKHSLSTLALRSIVELERMNAGLDYDAAAFSDLASALRVTSEPSAATLQFRFVEPGYYEPFERLYRLASSATGDVEQIQNYVKDVSSRLSAVAAGDGGGAGSLLPICVALHQELVQELSAEDVFAVHEQPPFCEASPAGIGAT
jgi:hypothetical protein